MVDVEWLKKNFRVSNVPGLGRCIIIPIYKFKPEWDRELLHQGYECHAGDDVVYVRLGPERERETDKISKRYEKWTEKEDQLLIELWNKGLSILEIVDHFPGRTKAAVKNRLDRLKRAGKIRPRWIKKTEKQPETSGMKGAEPQLEKLLSEIVKILKEHSKLLDKLYCQVLMNGLQIKQFRGELTIPPNLWIHYANAILEDDKHFQDVFREKVKQLLEACR